MKPIVAIRGCSETAVERFDANECSIVREMVAVEEPLEIRIIFGRTGEREKKSISVTMRTPGNDAELAMGFLLTEGVIRDVDEINSVSLGRFEYSGEGGTAIEAIGAVQDVLSERDSQNVVSVELAPDVEVSAANLQRNFYTTSSCGICGKASLLALRTVCPARRKNEFEMSSAVLYQLPTRLRENQGIFDRTGGLHAAALFDADGVLDSMREDVGRHNAVDKLIGAALLQDRVPLRDRILLLSGRASFELLQKALMAGIPMVASVGAPSSMAVSVAREFDITLVGFLRDDHFNVYHGGCRIMAGRREGLREAR